MNKVHTFHKKGAPDLLMRVRRCEPHELGRIMAIQEKITALIPDRYRYQPTTEDEVRESLEKDIVLGVYHGERLVGISILLSLRKTDRNLAYVMGYDEEYAMRCTTNDGSWVDPEYQGYGIQYFLSMEKDVIAAEMGALEMLACTSPLNYASQRSMIKNGYEIIDLKLLYGGNDRYILRKFVESEEEQLPA